MAGKSLQNENALCALTLEEICSRYPHKQWTHVYTDGSAEQAMKNAGCGVYIQSPNRQQNTLFSSCGARGLNFNAELQTLQLAVDYLIEDEGYYKPFSLQLTTLLKTRAATTKWCSCLTHYQLYSHSSLHQQKSAPDN